MNKRYSIFEIFVFVVFFPVILCGWLVRYIVYKRRIKKAELMDKQKIDLLQKISDKIVD